jgi:hypothetical protein
MALFNVTVREHTYTGRFYNDTVMAESCEEALQLAAERAIAPQPPPDSKPQQGSDVVVTEHAYPGRSHNDTVTAESSEEALQLAAKRATAPQPPPDPKPQQRFNVVVTEHAYPGRSHSDTVTAESSEEALQLAAKRATAPQPQPDPKPQPDAANRRRCADVWVYSLLHCELADGHDPPHMAVATGYRHPMRWVRDDRGLAHAFPKPATGDPPVIPPITAPRPAPEGISPQVPLTGGDG